MACVDIDKTYGRLSIEKLTNNNCKAMRQGMKVLSRRPNTQGIILLFEKLRH